MGTEHVRILVILLFGLQFGCEDKAPQTRADTPVVAVSPEVEVETTVAAESPPVPDEPSLPDEEPKQMIVTIQESSPDMRDALDQTAPKQGAAQVTRTEAGEPKVQGTLDREVIRRVVQKHRGEMRACYEGELKNDPSLAGQVTARFTISPNGSVVSAVVGESTLKNDIVERCMMNSIRRWVFPKPKGGVVVVNYPFLFSSAE